MRLFGPGAGAFYHDALQILAVPSMRTRGSYIFHSMREIQSVVFEVLGILPEDIGAFDRGRPEMPGFAGKRRDWIILRIADELGIPSDDPRIQWWPSRDFERLAHRNDLYAPRPFDPGDWAAFEDLLNLLVGRFEAVFKRSLDALDDLLRSGPGDQSTAKQVFKRLSQGPQPVALSHFFRHAGPEWVGSLPSDWLDNPPGPEPMIGRPDLRWHPSWPVANFLARSAEAQPSEVHARVMQIMATGTDNNRIHLDLADAERHIPGRLMATWAAREAEWLRRQDSIEAMYLMTPLAECVRNLAGKGQEDAAFDLARALFDLDSALTADLEIAPGNLDAYQYLHNIRPVAEALAVVRPLETVEWLAGVVAKHFPRSTGPTENRAWSDILAPSIADDSGANFELTNLVRVLRDVSAGLIANNLTIAPDVLAILTRREADSSVVQRVGLYLLGRHLPGMQSEAASLLAKSDLYAPELMPETYSLLAAAAPYLSPDQREAVRTAIAGGTIAAPAKDRLIAIVIAGGVGDEQPDPELAEAWQPVSAWGLGEASPVAQAKLASWTVPELVSYLTRWQPDNDWRALFAPEALRAYLMAAIANDPPKYAAGAVEFQNIQPIYLSAVFTGFTQAVSAKRAFEWRQVIELATFTLDDEFRRSDPSYADVRNCLASLLSTGLSADEASPAPELAAPIWVLLKILADDASPSRREEATALKRGSALASIALNWTRPIAVRAVIDYEGWIREHTEPRPTRLPTEARRILLRRLGATTEPCLSVRIVFARHLYRLMDLDPDWLVTALPRLFPSGQHRVAQWSAAFSQYLEAYAGPTGPMLQTLRTEYERATASLDPSAEPDPRDISLAHHLVFAIWWGLIGTEPLDPLIAAFYANASSALAKVPLDWMGWNLWSFRERAPLDSKIQERVRRFWEWRVTNKAATEEKESCGWWFASGLLDTDWSLAQLLAVIRTGGHLGGSAHAALERGKELAATHPSEIASFANEFIVGTPNDQEYMFADDLYAIARLVQDPTAPQDARQLCSEIEGRLLSRGYTPHA